MSVAHVFVADLEVPELDEPDQHHLSRALRLRPGEEVTASDGAGRWRRCRYATGRPGGGVSSAALEPEGPVISETPPRPAVGIGFVVTKGSRPEWVVQKLTEVGVDRIVPLSSSRSVVRWDTSRADRNVERLRRVAREAAMQSRRNRLPEVTDVVSFAEVAVGGAALAEAGGAAPSLERPFVLVGPEGGWDRAELACGLPLVGLGPTVLRAETAAVAAGVLLCALRTGLVS
ncbi:MAG TPA: RsmE family RNA methyltransferase [Acidimicrobiales bacterium]